MEWQRAYKIVQHTNLSLGLGLLPELTEAETVDSSCSISSPSASMNIFSLAMSEMERGTQAPEVQQLRAAGGNHKNDDNDDRAASLFSSPQRPHHNQTDTTTRQGKATTSRSLDIACNNVYCQGTRWDWDAERERVADGWGKGEEVSILWRGGWVVGGLVAELPPTCCRSA